MRYRVIPYRQGSESARTLSRALGGMVLRLEGSAFRPRPGDVLINWGLSRQHPRLAGVPVINSPQAVAIAANKLRFFTAMRHAEESTGFRTEYTPEFWTNRESIPSDAYPVVCRTILNGHGGAGIVIANSPSELVEAPLYVKYVKKKDEYRVHVGKGGQIIAVQRKARRRDVPDHLVNWQVRNHANGFVFVRNGVEPPECVFRAASTAVGVLGLDFGAVDVVYFERRRGIGAKVLEVNTAPGLAGSTVGDYVRYFTGGGNDD